jgi:hypothetical protein
MKGPLDDELDAGGTRSSVPYPTVLKNSKKEQVESEMLYGREPVKDAWTNKKGGAEAPPFLSYSLS